MSYIDYRYSITELPGPDIITYLFFSKGLGESADVLKVIQYAYVQHFNNKAVYNLGFGDYNIDSAEINDGVLTNNRDPYKIFNTVLSSIPLFFKKHPDVIILVQGSDGRRDFEAYCRLQCRKNCVDRCLNHNRRMKLYCSYVSRKFELLESTYDFLGGIRNSSDWFDFETYIPGKTYDAILVFQKKV